MEQLPVNENEYEASQTSGTSPYVGKQPRLLLRFHQQNPELQKVTAGLFFRKAVTLPRLCAKEKRNVQLTSEPTQSP
jgi:hypothetical protein